jgi:hypothetical protein
MVLSVHLLVRVLALASELLALASVDKYIALDFLDST